MAKAPWARLMKRISPSVTDKPTLIRNNSMPEAMPSKSTVTGCALCSGLARILEVGYLVELHVLKPGADLLHLADVDGLDDVARVGIDADGAARTHPFHALGGFDELIPVCLSAGFLQRFGDQVHSVVAAHRHEVRPIGAVGLVPGLDEGFVLRGI